MPSFTIKVPNDDEGADLDEYESDYLPRVGDPFVLWHPRVCSEKDKPFCGVVSGVTHEALHKNHPYAGSGNHGVVQTVVWLAEEHAPPTLYCVCSEEERAKYLLHIDRCDGCGYPRRKPW